MKRLEINLKEEVSKKTNKPYKYIQVVIGDWTGRLFVQSPFEMQYIEKYINSKEEE